MFRNILSVSVSLFVIAILVSILAYVAIKPAEKDANGFTQYVIVFPFGEPLEKSIEKIVLAGGIPVRVGSFENIIVIASKSEVFKENIYKKGAIFIFSPIIKGGCIIENNGRFQRRT